jgi:hypothetical protein
MFSSAAWATPVSNRQAIRLKTGMNELTQKVRFLMATVLGGYDFG